MENTYTGQWKLINEMNDLKTYGFTGVALLISAIDIIPALQIVSLILAIIYTGINIYKKMKWNKRKFYTTEEQLWFF